MADAIWLKSPTAVLAKGAEEGIVVDGDRIVELVASGRKPTVAVSSTINLAGRVVLPGLINTHHHFYQTLTRAVPVALNKPLFPWLQSLYQVWQNLDEEMLGAATELACLELMLSGATTIADHHYMFPAGLERAIDVP